MAEAKKVVTFSPWDKLLSFASLNTGSKHILPHILASLLGTPFPAWPSLDDVIRVDGFDCQFDSWADLILNLGDGYPSKNTEDLLFHVWTIENLQRLRESQNLEGDDGNLIQFLAHHTRNGKYAELIQRLHAKTDAEIKTITSTVSHHLDYVTTLSELTISFLFYKTFKYL